MSSFPQTTSNIVRNDLLQHRIMARPMLSYSSLPTPKVEEDGIGILLTAAGICSNQQPPVRHKIDNPLTSCNNHSILPSNKSVPKRRKSWNVRYEELRAYRDIHGDCNVPTHNKDNPSLGHWVNTQRKEYRIWSAGKRSTMNQERVKMLEDIGFAWNLQRHAKAQTWGARFEELQLYKEAYGHCNVPCRWKENPPLGQWVHTQRKEFRMWRDSQQTSMNHFRFVALQDIGFEWRLRVRESTSSRISGNRQISNNRKI